MNIGKLPHLTLASRWGCWGNVARDRLAGAQAWVMARIFLPALALLVLTGCQGPHVSQQRLVSQSNMLFSDSLPLNFSSRLIPQLETGASGSGGAANSGCTACK